ncbi:hypothetical protein F5883DRAFT_18312 [Diaporthe sp. PMI_573]|nr:hypothetical protein F5883DRAFT_18312 [Diaporthaceae sp. PMI_573]
MNLWSTFAWAAAVPGQLTTDARFIGWAIEQDSLRLITAGTGWSTSGTVAGDCDSPSNCVLNTACTSNTLFFDNGGSTTWSVHRICIFCTCGGKL